MRLSINTITYRFLFVINRNGKFTLGNPNNGEREKGRVEGKMKKNKRKSIQVRAWELEGQRVGAIESKRATRSAYALDSQC